MKAAVTVLSFSVAALLALGMVMLYSAKMTQGGLHYLVIQLIGCGLGLIGCVFMTWFDYRWFKRFALPLFVLAVGLLALVLTPAGSVRGGARRWFDFGPMSFQPSEVGKIAVIVFLAWYAERFQRQMRTLKRGIIVPGIIIGIPLALTFVEPDVGCALLLAAVSAAVLFIAGIRWRFFVPPILIGVVGLALFLYHDPVRSKRIHAWLHPEETRLTTGHQAYQSTVALGSGGWTGRGLGEGRQKRGFIPAHHTDFIFAVIGEELGLVATLGVLLTFGLLISSAFYISAHAADTFGFLLGSGITLLIGIQMVINIGVVTNVLPNKGMPLPFISYGGSNLLFMLCVVGILLSIARHAADPQLAAAAMIEPEGQPANS